MGYTKNIAVIKGIKEGFSADGGALSGLVKAEKYSSNLRVEINLINFAPLSEGRYVAAISDGINVEIVENCLFEGRSSLDTGAGFAAVICYVNAGVQLLASAVCGNFQAEVFRLKAEIERTEKTKTEQKAEKKSAQSPPPAVNYEDEAISEVNYYEFGRTDEGGEPLCEDEKKEKDGAKLFEDETDFGAVEKGPLARGGFYEKMKSEIEGLLSAYPHCVELEKAIPQSRWAEIEYGDGKFYVFGVIFDEGTPRYICYGVPSQDNTCPPESMRAISSFFPAKTRLGEGFWVMYQDADTGANIRGDCV